jgi:hypothetical protein
VIIAVLEVVAVRQPKRQSLHTSVNAAEDRAKELGLRYASSVYCRGELQEIQLVSDYKGFSGKISAVTLD